VVYAAQVLVVIQYSVLVVRSGYTRSVEDATTDFDEKYVKRCGSMQGCAFLRVAKPEFNIYTPFSQKPPFWGPILTVLRNFQPKNRFNIRGTKSKWP